MKFSNFINIMPSDATPYYFQFSSVNKSNIVVA
jgi:hypothetical protein